MSDRLVTERELEGMLRRLNVLETRLEREKREVPIVQTGAWTPILAGTTTAGNFTYNLTVTGGEWTRTGNRVWYHGRVFISAILVAPVGNMYIALPTVFTVASVSWFTAGVGYFDRWQGLTLAAGYTFVGGNTPTSARLNLSKSGSGLAAANVVAGEVGLIGGSIDLIFGGNYEIT